MKSAVFDKYKTDMKTFMGFLQRLRHITAIILFEGPDAENFIQINHQTIRYEKSTGYVCFSGDIVHATGGVVNLIDMKFPLKFVDDDNDDEIIEWRKSLTVCSDKSTPSEKPAESTDTTGVVLLSDLTSDGRSFNYNGENITAKKTFDLEKPLSTNRDLSKRDLINYLEQADIPDDAELTLHFDDGVFYMYFYWSEGPGAFGHTAVNFDIESDDLLNDSEQWKLKMGLTYGQKTEK